MNSPSLHKKKVAFKKWQRTRTNEHRNLNKNAKAKVAKTKKEAFKKLKVKQRK